MMELIIKYKDILQIVLVAIPGFLVTLLYNRWQIFGKNIDLINSMRSGLLSDSNLEKDLSFSMMIYLPNYHVVRSSIYAIPFDSRVELVKRYVFSAISSNNIRSLSRLDKIYPAWSDVLVNGGFYLDAEGVKYYGDVLDVTTFLNYGVDAKFNKMIILLLKKGFYPLGDSILDSVEYEPPYRRLRYLIDDVINRGDHKFLYNILKISLEKSITFDRDRIVHYMLKAENNHECLIVFMNLLFRYPKYRVCLIMYMSELRKYYILKSDSDLRKICNYFASSGMMSCLDQFPEDLVLRCKEVLQFAGHEL